MNNNQNNGSTIVLLLIIMMISSMMSSSGALLGFNLFTSSKPSENVKGYINQKDANIKALAIQAGVDEKELRTIAEEELRAVCVVYVDEKGQCPSGMQPKKNGCCEFKDIKNKIDLASLIGEVALLVLVSVMVETMLIVGISLGATVVSRVAARRFAQAVAAKMATRVAAGIATRLWVKFNVARACGGPCIAGMIAFELMSILLDLSNALGYDNFIENKVVRQSRNVSEVQMEEALTKDGSAPPLPFSPLVAFPEYQEEATQFLMGEFLPDVFSLMDKESMVKFFIATMDNDKEVSDQVQKEFETALDTAMKNTKKRDDLIYKFFVKKGKKNDIEKIPFLSSENVTGVGLTESAARKYNDRMKEQHLLYTNPFRPPPAEIPKEYSPYVAAYTDTYRVLNTKNPGTKDNPNMIEKKLPKKVCLLKPWGALVAFCEYGMRADNVMKSKVAQRLNPAVYGVKFNTERGDCDFTNDYCKRLALKLKNNECTLREGQKEAEMFLGKTVTRTYMEDWDNRIEAWESGDAASVAYATVTLPAALIMPWVNKATSAIKDTYGRGVGTPMKCGPDKDRKGALCYPKCRTGPNGEKLYKSRALECEGTCPSGSKNTGLTCLQSIHSYIPPNKSKSAEFWKKSFWERADCRGFSENEKKSALGQSILSANEAEIETRVARGKAAMLEQGTNSRTVTQRFKKGGSERNAIEAEYLKYTFRGTTCNQPCYPGFTFRSGAAGSAFCDKPRNRYSRAGDAKVPDTCPEGKQKQDSLCYKPCKDGYRGQGPTCRKSEESKQNNPYLRSSQTK